MLLAKDRRRAKMPGLQRIRLASSRKLPSGAIFDRPVMADRLSAEGGGQQELADEIRDLAGRLPNAGTALARVSSTGDPNDAADVIRGPVTIENLLDDRAGATASNDMEDDVVDLKHPVPQIDTIDPYAGLVGINH